MTPDQIEEARRWTALRGWRWMPRMRVCRKSGHDLNYWVTATVPEPFAEPSDGHEWIPDVTDPATRGCLLALAREITGRPTLTVETIGRKGEWFCRGRRAATETAALLGACERHEGAP